MAELHVGAPKWHNQDNSFGFPIPVWLLQKLYLHYACLALNYAIHK